MSKEIDMTGFFRKQASEGKNPFGLVTHVGNKKAKKFNSSRFTDKSTHKHIRTSNDYGDESCKTCGKKM